MCPNPRKHPLNIYHHHLSDGMAAFTKRVLARSAGLKHTISFNLPKSAAMHLLPLTALLSSLVLGESMREKHNLRLPRAEGGEGCRREVTEGDKYTAGVTWEHAHRTCMKA